LTDSTSAQRGFVASSLRAGAWRCCIDHPATLSCTGQLGIRWQRRL